MYRKVIGFKLGSYEKNFGSLLLNLSSTKGICICILIRLA